MLSYPQCNLPGVMEELGWRILKANLFFLVKNNILEFFGTTRSWTQHAGILDNNPIFLHWKDDVNLFNHI